jgi:2-polyprenyl-3-methyl-5-hydroxy-6-metoxy-1,4-benzoquinol methylase
VTEGDRERWNATWRDRAGELAPPAAFLVEHEALLPRAGRALDIAGGAGRHAVWLARRGLDVTLVDVSDVALEAAERRAGDAHVTLRLRRVDLEADDAELPAGPFDLVLCWHFLDRAHRPGYADLLGSGGLLVLGQPTITNLERHEKPGRRFLAEPGELHDAAHAMGLDVLVSVEGWNDDGRHEAAVIARSR